MLAQRSEKGSSTFQSETESFLLFGFVELLKSGEVVVEELVQLLRAVDLLAEMQES